MGAFSLIVVINLLNRVYENVWKLVMKCKQEIMPDD